MARRTKEEAEQTRDLLLQTAENLFYEKGVTKTSLEDIAKAAGMTRGAIYWHFEDKMALFNAMYEQAKLPFELLMDEVIAKNDPVEGLKAALVKSLENFVSDTRMQRVFTILMFRCENTQMDVPREQQCRNKVLEKMEAVLTKIDRMGRLSPALTPQQASRFLQIFFGGIYSDYVRHQGDYDLKKLAPVLVETFFTGLVKD